MLNLTATDSSTFDGSDDSKPVQIDVNNLYEITLLRTLWEIVMVLIRATKQEELALRQLFLAESHKELLECGMAVVNSGRFPASNTDKMLEAISDMSTKVARAYKVKMDEPMLTPMLRAFLADRISRPALDVGGPDEAPTA